MWNHEEEDDDAFEISVVLGLARSSTGMDHFRSRFSKLSSSPLFTGVFMAYSMGWELCGALLPFLLILLVPTSGFKRSNFESVEVQPYRFRHVQTALVHLQK